MNKLHNFEDLKHAIELNLSNYRLKDENGLNEFSEIKIVRCNTMTTNCDILLYVVKMGSVDIPVIEAALIEDLKNLISFCKFNDVRQCFCIRLNRKLIFKAIIQKINNDHFNPAFESSERIVMVNVSSFHRDDLSKLELSHLRSILVAQHISLLLRRT